MTIMGFNHGMHVLVVYVLNDDDNDNAKKKTIGFTSKTTALHVFHAF